MEINPEYLYLSKFNLFKKLTQNEKVEMSNKLIMRSFRKGERFAINSDQGTEVYFLKYGLAKVIGSNESGGETIKYLIAEGEVFGILNLTEGENANDYVVAIEDSLIGVLDSETLEAIKVNNIKLNNHLFELACLRIKKLERKLEAMIYKNAETRIKEFIEDYMKNYGRESGEKLVAKNILSNTDIGKLTSTSRQTVNKVLNDLKGCGYLDFDKDLFYIKRNYLI